MSLSVSNEYKLIYWKDRIWKIGPGGKLIPQTDENGQIIYNPISGQPEYEYLENGTRVNAKRLNHMDEGIYLAHDYIVELKATIRRMQIQMELDGRVPGNSGTFADTLDGSTNKIILDTGQTEIIEDVEIGTTTLKVASVEGFTEFTQVTIFDDVASEDVLITAVGDDAITVQSLANSYKKGAKIARSNVVIDTVEQEMKIGNWGTYSVAVSEVV